MFTLLLAALAFAPANGEKRIEAKYVFDRFPSPVSSFDYILWEVSENGSTLKLENGSTWKVSLYDAGRTIAWENGDPLFITQNTNWFSFYGYRIINPKRSSSIEVNLGDLKSEQTILSIDAKKKSMMLSDGSIWEVQDCALWKLGDSLLIGTNCGNEPEWPSLFIRGQKEFTKARASLLEMP